MNETFKKLKKLGDCTEDIISTAYGDLSDLDKELKKVGLKDEQINELIVASNAICSLANYTQYEETQRLIYNDLVDRLTEIAEECGFPANSTKVEKETLLDNIKLLFTKNKYN